MVVATYDVRVDLDDSELFGESGEDITADIMAMPALSIARGKDQVRDVAPPRAGSASCELDNQANAYGPSTSLRQGQRLRVHAAYGGTTYKLFRGPIEAVGPHDVRRKRTGLSALGTLSWLVGKERLSTALYESITTDVALGHLLDAVGWPKNLPDYIADLSPVGYWRLGEASGDALDSSGNGNDGTVTIGAGSRGAAALDDGGDGCIEFDGTDTTVVVPADAAFGNLWDGGGSLHVLMRPESFGEGGGARVLNHRNPPGWDLFLADDSAGTCKLEFYIDFSATDGRWQTTSRVLTYGRTYSLILSYSADSAANDPTIYLYDHTARSLSVLTVGAGLDELSSPVGTRNDDAGVDLRIGNNAAAGSLTFDGRIDEVALFGAVLTAAQARTLVARAMDAPRHLDTGKSTLAWWWLDGEDAWAAAQAILNSEGPGAALYEDGTGAVVFKSRHSRFTESRSTTPQATLRGTGTEPVMTAFAYDAGLKDVINVCELTIKRRAAGTAGYQWQTQQPYVAVAPSETAKVTARLDSDGPGQAFETGLLTTNPTYASTLAAALNSSDLTFTIPTGEAPTITTNAILDIEGEYLVVTGRTTGSPNDTVTVRARGEYGTTAASHLISTAVRTLAFLANSASSFGGTNLTDDITVSLNRTSGQTVEFSFTNNGGVTAYLFARLYGQQVAVQETYQIANTLDTSASQAQYGTRPYRLATREEIAVETARDFANAIVGWYQDGRPQVRATITANRHADAMTNALGREIGDRVTVVESLLGLNEDYYVDYVRHSIQGATLHQAEFGLESAEGLRYWVLDTDELDGDAVVGF